MRKKKRQQKIGKQLSLFNREIVSFRPRNSVHGRAMETKLGESNFFSQLSRNRALSVSLLERVMSATNLQKAYERVKRNGGMGGVDGMSVSELGDWLSTNSQSLREEILKEEYEPSAILGIQIPKSSGGTRQLGIPTVIDRLLQQAIHEELQKLYEPLFSDNSYGFRPKRSALQAVERSSEYISSGYHWVVDIDLKSFFDHICHDRLMQRLSKGIGDKRLLRLIHQYLRAGMLQDGLAQQRISGTPQGGPLSPLLSNIVLDELDKELEKRDHLFVRYADDCNIYVKSKRAGERVLSTITKFIESKLKLQVNESKSGVRRCSEVKFLGYTILPDGNKRIADKSIKRFKKKVKSLTKRNRGVSFSQVIEELNAACRGWITYFRKAEVWLPWRNLDAWIRRRLRCYRLKQCGRKYTVFKLLRRLGASESQSWSAIIYGGGWWHLSAKRTCQRTMSVRWFKEQGLHTLTDLYQRVNR